MAFRYLIYRTDFDNTIVRESIASSSTGGTEAELFTDFVIPEIQPLYLWRVSGGTNVEPNSDQNINNWLDNEYQPSPDDPITYDIFTGYTAQTQTDLDGKINIVTGATGNVGEFDASGNLIDTGLSIADITGLTSSDIYVSGMTYVGSTLTLQRTEGLPDLTVTIVTTGNTDGVVSGATLSGQTLVLSRTEGLSDVTADLSSLVGGIEGDIIALSGAIDQNTTDIQLVSGITTQNSNNILTISGDVIQNISDIQLVSGVTTQNSGDIQIVSGATDNNASDIIVLSGAIDQNSSDIAFISGVTDTKQDQLSAGEGINIGALSSDTIQVDLSAFTAIGGLDITLTGGTNAVINDLRTIAKGLEYGDDYNANFTVRSLVDKGYVDAVAAGLDLKESVRAATTSGETDIDLTLGSFGGVIDGYTLSDGDRVLIKNQDSAKQDNGIYIWSSGSATFARAVDFIDPNVTAGAFTFVETGTTLGGSGWVLVTPDPINIGTSELLFTMFSSTGSLTAGNGINITNGVVSVNGDDLNGNFIEWSGTQFNVTGLTTIVDFNVYTGVTDTRLTNLETNISTLSGDSSQLRIDVDIISGKTDQNTNDIAFISGVTDTKLDTSIFTGYTASTASNEIFLIHTGGTNLNSIVAIPILWDSSVNIGSAYTWTGGSSIIINDTGDYEVNYNIPFNQSGNNSDKGIGSNLILNNSTTIDNATSAGWTSRNNAAGSISLPTVNISLTSGDTLDLVGFRTASSGNAITSPNGTILIKKKDKLQ